MALLLQLHQQVLLLLMLLAATAAVGAATARMLEAAAVIVHLSAGVLLVQGCFPNLLVLAAAMVVAGTAGQRALQDLAVLCLAVLCLAHPLLPACGMWFVRGCLAPAVLVPLLVPLAASGVRQLLASQLKATPSGLPPMLLQLHQQQLPWLQLTVKKHHRCLTTDQLSKVVPVQLPVGLMKKPAVGVLLLLLLRYVLMLSEGPATMVAVALSCAQHLLPVLLWQVLLQGCCQLLVQ